MLYREEGYFFEKTTQWAKNVHEDIFDIISHFWPSVCREVHWWSQKLAKLFFKVKNNLGLLSFFYDKIATSKRFLKKVIENLRKLRGNDVNFDNFQIDSKGGQGNKTESNNILNYIHSCWNYFTKITNEKNGILQILN
jgi:hypothetical protein